MAKTEIPYAGPLVTRDEARARGERRFFSGEPCERGHIAQRDTKKGFCYSCNAAYFRDYYRKHPEKKAETARIWRERNPGYWAAYQAAQKEKAGATGKPRRTDGERLYFGPVISLKEAKAAGLRRYFNEMTCAKGHIAERLVSNQSCLACAYENKKARAAAKRPPKPPPPPVTIFYEGPVVTRREAVAAGAKAYFLGAPCPKGHIALRSTSSAGCRVCEGERQKRFRCEQPEAYEARHARYRTPENLEKLRKRMQARYRADPEAQRAKAKARRAAKPEHYRTLVRNRRAQRKKAEGSFTPQEFLRVLHAQKWRCAMCRTSLRKATPEADHIVPLAKGGTNYIRNIQALCRQCNRSKWSCDPIEYSQRIGLLL